jgi:hypothetical protein
MLNELSAATLLDFLSAVNYTDSAIVGTAFNSN